MPWLIWNLIPVPEHEQRLAELEAMATDLRIRAAASEAIADHYLNEAVNLRERAAFVDGMREAIKA